MTAFDPWRYGGVYSHHRMLWDRMKMLLGEWEGHIVAQPDTEIAAAANAMLKFCAEDLRTLIAQLERDYP